jgi:signal transduction histidine kinase
MRMWPRSMTSRTTLLVAAAIVLSHLAGLGIYIAHNAADLSSSREQYVADQLVTLIRLLERLPEGRRAETGRAISDQSLQLSIDDAPRVALSDAQEPDTRAFRHLLGFAIGVSLNEGILADYREIAGDDLSLVTLSDVPQRKIFAQRVARLFRFREDLLVSVQLSDGQWLNALVPGPAFVHFFNPGLAPSVALMAVVTLTLTVWALRRPLAALSDFARAAESLGMNPSHADPLPEQGPLEIRRAIRAFNRMQRRVQTLIEDRTRMVAAMSHDLRTPLTRMRLRAEYIDDRRERGKMFRDIDDMESMIGSTLRFVNEEASEEPRFRLDLGALLLELAEELGVPPPQLRLHGVPELSYTCSPVAMRRALSNVICNALTYGREATVSADLRPDEITILVDDQGPGIPEDERENVFLPFYRLEPSRSRNTGGAGLGLTIARSIIRAHGGDIDLLQAPAGGTRARIRLPLTSADAGLLHDRRPA